MKTNIEQVDNITELAKFRADVMLNKNFVLAAMYNKKGTRLVATKVSELKELLETQAKEYGKKIIVDSKTGKIENKQEADIIKEYTAALEKIVKQYDDNYKKVLDIKLKLEGIAISGQIIQNDVATKRDKCKNAPEYAKEQQLREELQDALKAGDYATVEEKNKELLEISKINPATKLENDSKNIRAEMAAIQEEIDKCTDLLRECEEERRLGIHILTSDLLRTTNEKALMVVKKDNWLKRSWNKFLNKVNGDKRYTNYVINPLNKKIRDINYKNMPPIRKQMSDKTARIKKSSKEKIANLEYIDVTKDNNIENQEPVAKVKISEKTYRTIISTARGEIGWRNTKALEKVHSSKQKKMKTVEEKELDK